MLYPNTILIGDYFNDQPVYKNGALTRKRYNIANIDPGGSFLAFNLYLNAYDSNLVYQDNGTVMPLSISKQSFIIYK